MSNQSEINSYNAVLHCPTGGILGNAKCYTCPSGFAASKSGNEIICTGTPVGQIAAFPGSPAVPAKPGNLANPPGIPAIPEMPALPAVNGTCNIGTLTPSSTGGLPVCVVKTQFQ